VAYFLKKTTLKGRTYLSIVDSFYSHKKKGTAHKTYQSLGSVETNIENGIEDPIEHFQKVVDELNRQRELEGVKKISKVTIKRKLGYFPLKAVMNKLRVKEYLDLFKHSTKFDFDLFTILSSLVYARCVHPCSKHRTFHDVLPCLCEEQNFTYYQLLEALSYLGNDYKKFVQLFTGQTKSTFKIDTSTTFFDCTNFYFEIDKEDDFRKKGPSKENKKCPIVGLGLLLDANKIPVGMEIFPGNCSEMPILRKVVDNLKKEHSVKGRTIQVADKGLNCAENVLHIRKNGDGYIFSKSIKLLPKTEKVWVLNPYDYKEVRDMNGKVEFRYKECIDKFPYKYVDENNKEHIVMITEKRIALFNPKLQEKQILEINKLALKAENLCTSQAKKQEYGDSAKYINFETASKGEKVLPSVNQKKIDEDKKLAGYNLLITSEIKYSAEEIYKTYHELWQIEESFKIMKSDLDARPVFLQKKESIKGHFFICYVSVLLMRLLQFKVLKNKYSSSELNRFFKEYEYIKHNGEYINTTTLTPFIEDFTEFTKLPLTHLTLSETKLKGILDYKI